jgi:hypothetical protein
MKNSVEVMSDKDMAVCLLEKLLAIEGIDFLKQSGITEFSEKKTYFLLYIET